MPRKREYETNADRQRAYRQRKKQRKLDAQGIPLDAQVGKAKSEETFVNEVQQAGDDAIEAFFRR